MLHRLKERTANIGFFAVGHDTYWGQFEGLLDSLMGYHRVLKEILEGNGVRIVDYGMVDSSEKGYEVLERMKGDRLDLVFCNMVTYATSSTFAPMIRGLDAPMVLVALQPLRGMDYSRASTYMQLENDNICSVPEFTSVAVRLGKRVADVIIGTLYEDEEAVAGLREWCGIAKVLHDLKGARMGLMGHVLEAMYDMHADPTAISAAFGVHVPLLEPDDAIRLYHTVTEQEIADKKKLILAEFDTPEPVSDPVTTKLTEADLHQAAHSAVTLDKLIETYRLTGLAYYYEGLEDSLHRKLTGSFIAGNSMLNAQGFPMCGEYDIKTCLAMLMMDRLGIGGSFAEFHPFDFREDFILVGHDGPHHLAIAEGKPVLRSLCKYHGKPGSGASVEFKIKEGPITMLGITQKADGRFKFVIGEGISRKGPIPPTGNTNTRGFFEPNTKAFVKAWVMEGPTHHFALGVGHHAGTLEKLAGALGIDSVIVKA
ncbi:L-fucose/L-arabinose isomerase family protein [Paenibacillus sp. YN15]|uniref:L-fucose/L-arabinose isomerase family protein n=1 Tax=Paenibacillus sp. YN15 TaxID=1742774 RepID=UPI000DCBAC7B|nr:L-fucose/L-arabinose isomerase family protein [Paenibacillus sp. YN15]RAV05582.1 arabinose isomerase [Paenibacillus sp. YN15]